MTSIRQLRARAEQTYGGEGKVVESLCRMDLVVLDDLFRERDTPWVRELTYTVTDALYKMRVPVVVTTNATEQFLRRPDATWTAVVERLKERCERVKMDGANRRQMRCSETR